jgi:cephalosporin hydroxylase
VSLSRPWGKFWRRNELERLKSGAWRARAVPRACATVPTMLLPDELRLLEFLAEEYYRGEGVIVDAGCFMGGSTTALASGLRANLKARRQPERKLIRSFDLFLTEQWTRGVYVPKAARAGDTFRPMFDRHVAEFAPLIEVHEGDITTETWPADPIEILFIDIAKHWSVCDWLTATLFPRLIPGRSIVVQQDYLLHHWNGWLHVTMEYFSDEFEMLCDTGSNSVVFRLTKPFAPGRVREKLVERLSTADKAALMDCAIARFSGPQAELLRSAKAHFLAMVDPVAPVPFDLIMAIQQGTMPWRHRGSVDKNPLDLTLYPMLVSELRPATLIEAGNQAGVTASCLRDIAVALGIEMRVATAGASLADLPRPWLAVVDTEGYETTLASLRLLDRSLRPGDHVLVEDGVAPDAADGEARSSGKARACADFLAEADGRYVLDARYRSYFGGSFGWAVDAWLRRVR